MERNSRGFWSAYEAKLFDKKVNARIGIPVLLLMENAGSAVAYHALRMLGKRKKVVIFCGKGNNGGDGLVAGRHLVSMGVKPDIFMLGGSHNLKSASLVNFLILKKLGQKISELNSNSISRLKKTISSYDLIIDAIFGVGLRNEVGGLYADVIGLINSSGCSVLSVDLPSGMNADTGMAMGDCVKADRTVTFMMKKAGMCNKIGLSYCGKIIVSNLGVPKTTV
ncbi:MAG: NAD(P)H-hydrate epimerase [Candidatus Omnitrophota bacterium]|jgi:NAD(P)H-hydrate epimerase|nr:MAG: NAD(P)H-hydrate epimerase [Candidatus Omnitrophota bacterium]